MATSAWKVYIEPASKARTNALNLWGAQLALNGAWSWIFFGAQKPAAALVEILAMFATISAYAFEAYKVDPAAAWLIAPYLAWTGLASALNAEIVRLNP
jgi:tryptophan-rich sensory protein